METVKIVIIKGLLFSQLIFYLEMQHLGVRTEQLCCLLRNFAPIAIQTFKNSPCGTKRQTVQSIREATKMQHFFRVISRSGAAIKTDERIPNPALFAWMKQQFSLPNECDKKLKPIRKLLKCDIFCLGKVKIVASKQNSLRSKNIKMFAAYLPDLTHLF